MLGIIGKKIGMTTLYDPEGRSIPCTLVTGGPCVVTQIKNLEKDGYQAVQLGYDQKKKKNTTKPLLGHFNKADVEPQKQLIEFKKFSQELGKELQLGQTIRAEDIFVEGDYIDVTGTTKGKGFQGVVKRHGFSGIGEQTHGQHNRQRSPGSVGASSFPSRVFKGMKMAGRTGGNRVKITNLKIMKIVPQENLLVLSGAIPGSKNAYIILEK